ncbi:hypothetical protein IWQ57_000545 [Coemansia nantahalensis]|uniref:Uncharacterized protein n=1 Tax=Coemansia nantahalensis TaxID=2789366 RepID=A0ACC1K7T9_9FUNG|nr:hypothetical protein IWQ57_000545 [Coemansia nantahalensis]
MADDAEPRADAACEGDGSSTEQRPPSAAAAETQGATLKQVYGMLCWLLVDDNSKAWRKDHREACRTAIAQCPHLAGADAAQLQATMDRIGVERQRILDAHGGQADAVPRDTRLFDGGPLFVIVDNALAGRAAQMPPADLGAALRVHAMGPEPAHAAGGAVRRPDDSRRTARGSPYAALAERARRLTPEEVRQMRDELHIRRDIALRDARLMADWTAMKRRELELQEARIRRFIKTHEDGTVRDADIGFDEFMSWMEAAQP